MYDRDERTSHVGNETRKMSIPEEMLGLNGKKRIEGVIWRKLALDMLCERPYNWRTSLHDVAYRNISSRISGTGGKEKATPSAFRLRWLYRFPL